MTTRRDFMAESVFSLASVALLDLMAREGAKPNADELIDLVVDSFLRHRPAWRRRRIQATRSELGAYGYNIDHPSLAIERTSAYEVGFQSEFGRNYAVQVTGFAKDQSGLTGLLEDGVTPHNLLGGLGSALAYTGRGQRYIATPDRGPADGALGQMRAQHVQRIDGIHARLTGIG